MELGCMKQYRPCLYYIIAERIVSKIFLEWQIPQKRNIHLDNLNFKSREVQHKNWITWQKIIHTCTCICDPDYVENINSKQLMIFASNNKIIHMVHQNDTTCIVSTVQN